MGRSGKGFVGLMLGRFDILAITMVRDTEHLAEFVHRNITGLPGVRRTESTLGVNFVKHDYRMARIVGQEKVDQENRPGTGPAEE